MILNLLDRMKLPFRKNKEFLSALYEILGFYPHDINIYRTAFSHKSLSYRREAPAKDGKGRARGKDRRPRNENTSRPLNNERLEYLGDAVLETVVSDILFRHFEHKREGFLTSTRSKIVQREALNRLAEQMGLEKLIQAAQGTRMSHTNIGGNAFEALMGAIYLDRGFKYCHWFITHRVIGLYVDLDNVAQKEVNFKSKLLEWCQKNRISTNFNDTQSNDPERSFQSSIVLEGITVGRGLGRSKKESQQEASKDALLRMRREQKLYDSIFRAKEKRTAMEADESFALPHIDELDNSLALRKNKRGEKPVLEGKDAKGNEPRSASDAAYDEAYGADTDFEVITGSDSESEYSEYATSIQPDNAPDETSAETRPSAQKKRNNQRRGEAKQQRQGGKQRSADEAKPASKPDADKAEGAPAGSKDVKPKADRRKRREDSATKPTSKKGDAPNSDKATEPKVAEKVAEISAPSVDPDVVPVSADSQPQPAEAMPASQTLSALTQGLLLAKEDSETKAAAVQPAEPETAAEPKATEVVVAEISVAADREAEEMLAQSYPVASDSAPQPAEPITKPILRHISIDEFVFGATEAMPDDAETEADTQTEADAAEHRPARRKARRGRSRRVNGESSPAAAPADETADAAAPSEAATEAPADGEAQGEAPAKRRRSRRRRPRRTEGEENN